MMVWMKESQMKILKWFKALINKKDIRSPELNSKRYI